MPNLKNSPKGARAGMDKAGITLRGAWQGKALNRNWALKRY